MTITFEEQAAGLVQVHRAIDAALERLILAPPEALWLPGHVRQTARFVLAHHHLEDTVLFPTLRERARVPVSRFLEERDLEHRRIHTLAARLAPDADAVPVARDLREALASHVPLEEAGLSADALRRMIDLGELEALAATLKTKSEEIKSKQHD